MRGYMTIRDREIVIARYAMLTFIRNIYQVRDHWRPEDIEVAEKLCKKLIVACENARERRKREDAENSNGRE